MKGAINARKRRPIPTVVSAGSHEQPACAAARGDVGREVTCICTRISPIWGIRRQEDNAGARVRRPSPRARGSRLCRVRWRSAACVTPVVCTPPHRKRPAGGAEVCRCGVGQRHLAPAVTIERRRGGSGGEVSSDAISLTPVSPRIHMSTAACRSAVPPRSRAQNGDRLWSEFVVELLRGGWGQARGEAGRSARRLGAASANVSAQIAVFPVKRRR